MATCLEGCSWLYNGGAWLNALAVLQALRIRKTSFFPWTSWRSMKTSLCWRTKQLAMTRWVLLVQIPSAPACFKAQSHVLCPLFSFLVAYGLCCALSLLAVT